MQTLKRRGSSFKLQRQSSSMIPNTMWPYHSFKCNDSAESWGVEAATADKELRVSSSILSVAMSPDDDEIIAIAEYATRENTSRISVHKWTRENSILWSCCLGGKLVVENSLCFSPDGKMLCFTTRSKQDRKKGYPVGRVEIIDFETSMSERCAILTDGLVAEGGSVYSIHFSANSRILAVSVSVREAVTRQNRKLRNRVILFDVRDKTQLAVFTQEKIINVVRINNGTSSGRVLLAVGDDAKRLILRDITKRLPDECRPVSTSLIRKHSTARSIRQSTPAIYPMAFEEDGFVLSADFSLDGKQVAYAAGSKVFVRSTVNGALIHQFVQPESKLMWRDSVHFCKGLLALKAPDIKAVDLHDVLTGHTILSFQQPESMTSMHFSENSTFLATSCKLKHGSDQVIIHQVEADAVRHEEEHIAKDGGGGAAISCIAFSEDGKLLMVGDQSRKILLRDTQNCKPKIPFKNGAEFEEYTLSKGYPISISFSSDSKLVAICEYDEAAEISIREAARTLRSDGTLKPNHRLVVRDVESGGVVDEILSTVKLSSVYFSPVDPNILVFLEFGSSYGHSGGHSKQEAVLRNISTSGLYGRPHDIQRLDGHEISVDGKGNRYRIVEVCFKSDGQLATMVRDGETGKYVVAFHDIEVTSKVEKVSHEGHILEYEGTIRTMRLSPDGQLISVFAEGKAEVNFVDGGKHKHTIQGDQNAACSAQSFMYFVDACFTPNSKMLAVATYNHKLIAYDMVTGVKMYVLEYERSITSVKFSPDGKLIAAGDGSTLDLRCDPLEFPPLNPDPASPGLFRRAPGLLIIPYPISSAEDIGGIRQQLTTRTILQSDIERGRLTTPLHEMTAENLEQIVRDIQGTLGDIAKPQPNYRIKLCGLQHRDYESPLHAAVAQKNPRKLRLMLRLINLFACENPNDKGSGPESGQELSQFLALLPGEHDDVLAEFMERCILSVPKNLGKTTMQLANKEFVPHEFLSTDHRRRWSKPYDVINFVVEWDSSLEFCRGRIKFSQGKSAWAEKGLKNRKFIFRKGDTIRLSNFTSGEDKENDLVNTTWTVLGSLNRDTFFIDMNEAGRKRPSVQTYALNGATVERLVSCPIFSKGEQNQFRFQSLISLKGIMDFLSSKTKNLKGLLKEQRNYEREVEAIAIGPPHFIRYTFPAIAENASVELYESEVCQLVIEYLWEQVWHLYYFLSGLFIFNLLLFSYGHYLHLCVLEDASLQSSLEKTGFWPPNESTEMLSRWCFASSGVISLFFFIMELIEIHKKGIPSYIRQGWNCVELLAYILGPVSGGLTWFDDGRSGLQGWPPPTNILGASAMMVLWIAALSHLRGHESFSVIVKTFAQIITDIQGFIGIVILLWLGGTMAFKVLLPGHPRFRDANALVSVWQMLMGDPMMDDLEVEANSRSVFGILTSDHALETTVMAKCLSMFFVFICVVVLMNQLIALMGESYRKVMSNLRVQNLQARARMIVSLVELYGRGMSMLNMDLIEPKWLHVLRPKTDSAGESDANTLSSSHHIGVQFKMMKKSIKKLEDRLTLSSMVQEKSHLSVIQDISESQAKVMKVNNKVDQLMHMVENLLLKSSDSPPGLGSNGVGTPSQNIERRTETESNKASSDTVSKYALSRMQSHLNHEEKFSQKTSIRQKHSKRNTLARVEAMNKLRNSKKMKEVKIFNMLDDNEISKLVEHMHLQVFERGQNIVKQGDEANSFYIIIGGQCSVWRRRMTTEENSVTGPDDNDLGEKVGFLQEFQHFGESALMGFSSIEPGNIIPEPARRNSTVQAESQEVKVLCLNSNMLRTMMRKGQINGEQVMQGILAEKQRRIVKEKELENSAKSQ